MSALDLGPRPALVIVDMQNAFCDAGGHRAALGLDHVAEAAVVEPIARILAAARDAALPVAFTRFALRPDYADAGLLLERFPGIRTARSLIRDTWATEIVPALTPARHELVIDKTRHSAFHATGLDGALRDRGAQTLIVCGVTTNMCVEGTVRDAFARDFRVVVPADACAAPTAAMHEAGLTNIRYGFGTVTTTDAVVGALAPTPAGAA